MAKLDPYIVYRVPVQRRVRLDRRL